MAFKARLGKAIMSLALVATLFPVLPTTDVSASKSPSVAEGWLKNNFNIKVDISSEDNQKLASITKKLQNEYDVNYTNNYDYNVSMSFLGVGGWGDSSFHSREKAKLAQFMRREAFISRWVGVFTNEFAGITSTSGDAKVLDMQNFNIKKKAGDSDSVSSGANMVPIESLYSADIMMLLDPAGYYSIGDNTDKMKKRSERIIERYSQAQVYDADADKLSPAGVKGTQGIMEVTNKNTGEISKFFRMTDLAIALGGILESQSNFNGLPGFSTEAGAYRGYNLYHMTPYPEIIIPEGEVPFVTKTIAGKQEKGIILDYRSYGYNYHKIDARVGEMDTTEIDTMVKSNSERVRSMLDTDNNWTDKKEIVVVPGESKRVGGNWVPGKNVEYEGKLFISLDQLEKYKDKDDNIFLEINDGYERRSYAKIALNYQAPPPAEVKQPENCTPATSPTAADETPYFKYTKDTAPVYSGSQYFGQALNTITGKFKQFASQGFTPNSTQTGILHNSTLSINGKSAKNDAIDVGKVCVTESHIGANGVPFNDVITQTYSGNVNGTGGYKAVANTSEAVVGVSNADGVKSTLKSQKYSALNTNPQFIVDSLSAQYQNNFFKGGSYENSILYSKLSTKQIAPFAKDITPQDFFYEFNGLTSTPSFLKLDYVAQLSGANVKTTEQDIKRNEDLKGVRDSDWYYRYCVRWSSDGKGNSYCAEYKYYYKKFFSFEKDESYYQNDKLLTTEYTSADKPAIKRFYQDGNGDVVIQFTAEGYNSAGVSADLLYNYNSNKAKLPSTIQDLDKPSNPNGGYWRKLVFDGFDSAISSNYKVGGSQPFIQSLGSASKSGNGLQKLSVTDLKLPSGVTKDDKNNRIVIPKDKVQEWFKLNETLNLGSVKNAHKTGSAVARYEASKYTTTDKAGYNDLDSAAKTLTLYVADQYGRFDWLTLNYMPNGSKDGNKSPDFVYHQGNDYNEGPGSFTHTDPNGNGNNLNYGHNTAVQIDVTRPDFMSNNKPSLLAVWENDNESIRYGYGTNLAAVAALDYLPFKFKTSSMSKLYNNGPAYSSPVKSDGSLSRTNNLKVDAWNANYKRFDPVKWLASGTFTKIGVQSNSYYKDFPQVIRAGRGVFFESQITIRAVLEGETETENVTAMKNFVGDIFNNYKLTGEKDATLMSSNRTYRNLNNNVSGEAAGGTSAKFNGTYGSMKLEYSGSGTVSNAVANSGYTSTKVNAYEDANGKKQIVRTVFTIKLPVRLASATGKFGGQTSSKNNAVTGRQFLIHPNTQDGVYTLRTEGSGNLAKLGLTGKINFFSALDPLIVYGSIFDNYEESQSTVEIKPSTPSSGGNGSTPPKATDPNTGKEITLPDLSDLLN
ncbi:hypothetical protein ABGV42_01745 [Paenibacillus pabuli]|uniref:hypothetical protein n=1 Tax=Paenibacillus pabuli TaxID=1472 RepID=UPI0032421CCE